MISKQDKLDALRKLAIKVESVGMRLLTDCGGETLYADDLIVWAAGEIERHDAPIVAAAQAPEAPAEPTDVLEHMVAFRTLRRNIRCWVRVERARWENVNALGEDYEQMYHWVLENKMSLDAISTAEASRFIARKWPMCNAVEVLEGSTLCGCVYYPEWP
jgi:hypothetical protein